jgi:hypothetical protein
MKKLILMLTASLAINGCKVGDPPPPQYYCDVYTRSYIMGYMEPTGIWIDLVGHYGPAQLHERILLRVYGKKLGNYTDTGEKQQAYDALCEEHRDMDFNRTRSLPCDSNGTPLYVLYASNVDPVAINVTSDADYDNDHPAGSSLNDIFTLCGRSNQTYIDGGYIETDECYIEKNLSEITAEDLIFSTSGSHYSVGIAGLRLDALPTLSKVHNFTITVTFERGKVFSETIEMVFE